MQTGYKVMDVMTNKPITANKEISLRDAAKIMEETNVNSLMVMDGEIAAGIITDEDFVRKAVAKGLDPKKMRLKDVMSADLVSIEPDMDIYDALLTMRDHNIRQLPVLSNNKLLGFLTTKDILKIEPELMELIVEKYEIREESRKMQLEEDDFSKYFKKSSSKKIKK